MPRKARITPEDLKPSDFPEHTEPKIEELSLEELEKLTAPEASVAEIAPAPEPAPVVVEVQAKPVEETGQKPLVNPALYGDFLVASAIASRKIAELDLEGTAAYLIAQHAKKVQAYRERDEYLKAVKKVDEVRYYLRVSDESPLKELSKAIQSMRDKLNATVEVGGVKIPRSPANSPERQLLKKAEEDFEEAIEAAVQPLKDYAESLRIAYKESLAYVHEDQKLFAAKNVQK